MAGWSSTGAVCITSSRGSTSNHFESFVLVCTYGMYWYVLVCTGMYWYVLVCTGVWWYLLAGLGCPGVDRITGSPWHLPTTLGGWGGGISGLALPSVTCRKHEQCFCRDLESEVAVLWVIWCQELSLLEGRVGHIRRILPGSAARCLNSTSNFLLCASNQQL